MDVFMNIVACNCIITDIGKDVLIGIAVSLVASFIWWLCSQLYSIETRKKVNYKLMLLRKDNYSYQKYLNCEDYDLALNQAKRMLDEIGEIFYSIKPLTYTRKKRKLINTLLSSLHINIARFQSYYKGYENDVEKKACCSEAKRHLYVVGYVPNEDNTYPDPDNFESVSAVTIELLFALNLSHIRSIRYILKTACCFNGHKTVDKRKKLYRDLVDINAFSGSMSNSVATEFNITTDVLTQKKYYKIVDSIK